MSDPEDWSMADLEDMAADQVRRGLAGEDPPPPQGVVTTALTGTPLRRVRWLWQGRIALGTLNLLAGREGLGKSTVGYWLAAQITRGELPGELFGQPKAVVICATEDTWAETIVPRLVAAGADLARCYRVESVTTDGVFGELILPTHVAELTGRMLELDAALLLLDPLISRLGRADTHKDGETRQALEPLARMAGLTSCSILGLIHHSKGQGADLVGQVMGSRAFTAVSRSVHTVAKDPEAEADAPPLLFGTVKNNMGPELGDLAFRLESIPVGVDELDGTEVTASRVVWCGPAGTTLEQAAQIARELAGGPSQIREAVRLLRELLDAGAGVVASKEAKARARDADIAERTLHRARERLNLLVESGGWPRVTLWVDPATVPTNTPPAGYQDSGATTWRSQ